MRSPHGWSQPEGPGQEATVSCQQSSLPRSLIQVSPDRRARTLEGVEQAHPVSQVYLLLFPSGPSHTSQPVPPSPGSSPAPGLEMHPLGS